MFKKFIVLSALSFLLAAAMMCTASAAAPLVDFNFSTGEAVDHAGGSEVSTNGDVKISNNSSIGNYAEFFAESGTECRYLLKGQDFSKLTSYSIELYMNLYDSGSFDIFKIGRNNVNLVSMRNDNGTEATYFGAGQYAEGDADVFVFEGSPRDEWVHVVLTSDGHKQTAYVNGEEFMSDTFEITTSFADSSLIQVGYNGSTDFDRCIGMDLAFFRFYDTCVSQEETAALYKAALEYKGVPGSQPPSEDPGDQDPTEQPSESPSASASVATPVPTRVPQQSNTQTFDLGLVSLTAMALSALASIKKRK